MVENTVISHENDIVTAVGKQKLLRFYIPFGKGRQSLRISTGINHLLRMFVLYVILASEEIKVGYTYATD